MSREEYEKCIQRRAKLEFDGARVLKALLDLEKKAAEIKERQKLSEADYAKARGETEQEAVNRKRAQLNVEVLGYNKVLADELGQSSAILKAGDVYNNDCANRSYAIGPKAPIIVPFGPAVLPRVDKMN